MGLSGRPRGRPAFGLTMGFYALASLADYHNSHTTVLALLIALLIGSAIGSGLRYAFGSASERPPAEAIALELASAGVGVVEMRRTWAAAAGGRRHAATPAG